MLRNLFRTCFACLALAAAARANALSDPPEARLLRFPDVRGDLAVFVYGGDIWRAPVSGGAAYRLTSHPALELFPKISPDGQWIAFTAEYTGSRQVYVMPSAGGPSRQLTFYSDVGPMPPRGGWDNWILGWTNDGKILVRMNRTPFGERMGRYFLVDPRGGLEQPLPLPEGGSASLSPDGKKLAYCPIDREFRTWKRTLGGRAQDIWIFDFDKKKSLRLTSWKGTDNFPMWWKDTVYFTSDREGTLNIFALDLASQAVRKVTKFEEFDVLWPSLGGNAIIFMNGGYLYTLDLPSEKLTKLPLTLGADIAEAAPHFKDVKGNIVNAALSPSGARALFEARGDLFSVPAKDGQTRNLTNTQGVREMGASWSPDGKSIVYLSDATGEYEIYLRDASGTQEPRQLTKNGTVAKFNPVFSADSKRLAFSDRTQRLYVLEIATGAISEIDKSVREDLLNYSFSPDGKYLVYAKSYPSRLLGISIYSFDQKKSYPLGDGMTSDTEPVFSADGKYLFFISDRDYNLTFSAFEFNYVYTDASRVYAVALSAKAPALFPPKNDEEKGKTEEKPAEKPAAKTEKMEKSADEKPAEPTVLDPAGFMARTVALPGLKPGNYRNLEAVEGAVFYVKGDGPDSALYRYDLKERKEEKALDGVTVYTLSRDGKKLLFRSGKEWGLADAKASLKPSEGKLDLSGLVVKLDPRAEWKQIWADGLRITRDWFYDEKLHGYDWKTLAKRYGALVPFVTHRADIDFLFGEILGELEAGHTYVASGDEPKVARIEGGKLGADLIADPSGRYRITKIYAGENWHDDYRSPLTEPGVDVKEGDFLIAIDGAAVTTKDNPYSFLENKTGKQVILTVNSQPSAAGARQTTIRPVESELNLFYLDWVRSRMALTEKLSAGKIGYIHLPDTAQDGNRMLQKMFYGQANKQALVIDDRYNGGGFIPDRTIEYFARKTLAWWARRGIEGFTTPGFANDGPKAMLINGYSSSGGDALPYFFKKHNLGTLIGTRTWGGLIGLSGNPAFVDGGTLNVPTFRIHDEKGNWIIENEGVSPDIEVIDLPEARMAGGDPSLEKAVAVLLEELKKNPPPAPKVPVPPDMTKN